VLNEYLSARRDRHSGIVENSGTGVECSPAGHVNCTGPHTALHVPGSRDSSARFPPGSDGGRQATIQGPRSLAGVDRRVPTPRFVPLGRVQCGQLVKRPDWFPRPMERFLFRPGGIDRQAERGMGKFREEARPEPAFVERHPG